jgi:hypothetical protein
MCLSHEQRLLAARTAPQWPIERLQMIVASSGIIIQIIPSIFDWRRERAEAARAARLASADMRQPSKQEPEGLPISVYAERHHLGLATVYQQVQRGVLVAVRVGGRLRVQA